MDGWFSQTLGDALQFLNVYSQICGASAVIKPFAHLHSTPAVVLLFSD